MGYLIISKLSKISQVPVLKEGVLIQGIVSDANNKLKYSSVSANKNIHLKMMNSFRKFQIIVWIKEFSISFVKSLFFNQLMEINCLHTV